MNYVASNASIFIHIAAMFYVAGFLVRDQLLLRMLVLTGTTCYLGYYYFALDNPLWDAFFWSAVMGLANLSVILRIVLERTTFNMSEEEKRLFKVFDSMLPGEFRRLLKISTSLDGDGGAPLTREGQPVENLYYVLDGDIKIEKKGQTFNIADGAFIGEVAFFLHSDASATARVEAGGRYVKWRGDDLRQLQKKFPGIRVALHSILNSDMATKVAQSLGSRVLA
jgi:hypothetical protein